MAKPVDVELTIVNARDLKNVNWRYGQLRPYTVAWVDPGFKVSTRVDPGGDTNPYWNEKLTIPVTRPLQDAELQIDVVHEKPEEGTKPLIGTARIPLTEVLDEVGFDEKMERTLKLKRPSGRPQGKLEVAIRLREKRWPEPQYPSPGGYPQPYGTRDYAPPQGYPPNYPSYPSQQHPYANPPTEYPNPYGNPYSQPSPYESGSYYNEGSYGSGSAPPAAAYSEPEKQKSRSKYGLGTGLAVGAVAGVLGGVALVEGAEYLEDKIADDAAEKVEEDLAADEYYEGDDY
uniref:C2 domain-containing protein n=1 Tax=Araucaria cunninghamii TaxID=56994 RepID=A0A0D6QRB5_ARACU